MHKKKEAKAWILHHRVLSTLLVISCLPAFPLFSAANEVEGISITDYGIYKADVMYTQEQEGVATGKFHKFTHPELIEKTERIPAVLGTEFGVRYIIKGSPKGESTHVVEKWIHPELKNPRTKKAFGTSEYVASSETGKVLYSAYKFEKSWELVPGKWTFQIYYDGKKLLEHTFNVYEP